MCFLSFLWKVRAYQMLSIGKQDSKQCWNESSWMTIWTKGQALTGSTHSNFFLSCISCSLQTYSRDDSWKFCLITSTDMSAWRQTAWTKYCNTWDEKVQENRERNHHIKIKKWLGGGMGFSKSCLYFPCIYRDRVLPAFTTQMALFCN